MSPTKTLSRILLAGALASASGCAPAILDWAPEDAPKNLRVDVSHNSLPLAFAAKSSGLGASEAARLQRFLAEGGVQPDDRLIVETADAGALSVKRRDSVAAALHRQGFGGLVVPAVVPGVGHDKLVLSVERAIVTLPNCPDWSKPPTDYSAQVSSNFGCATAMNLGMMVADPNDLVRGRPTGPGTATSNVGAILTYQATLGRGAPGAPPPYAPGATSTETK